MRQLRYDLCGGYVLSVLEVPWDKADPRGQGGQYEFHCNEIKGGVSYITRNYTFWGPTDGPSAIEKLTAAERAFDETFARIEDDRNLGVPPGSAGQCETLGY
mgnify:CR=1 FL=1